MCMTCRGFCEICSLYTAVLCVDKHSNMAAGVSTGGAAFKTPGRVGDSPLPGCGYYVDDKVVL